MGRSVPSSTLVRAQADFFSAPGSAQRAVGVLPAHLTASLFFNNQAVGWSVEDGAGVADSSISSGKVLFHEIPGASGHYSVRFFPDRAGFWRLVLRHATLLQECVVEADVTSASAQPGQAGGLNASFTKP